MLVRITIQWDDGKPSTDEVFEVCRPTWKEVAAWLVRVANSIKKRDVN